MKPRLRIVLHGRHFCSTCDNRVLPYDSLERETEAPTPGARGGPILLASANAARARSNPGDPSRTAWCFVCKKWTETYRLSRADLVQRYLNRRGVTFRYKRGGGAIIRLAKRRSA